MDGERGRPKHVSDGLDGVRNGDGLGQEVVKPMAQVFFLFHIVVKRGDGTAFQRTLQGAGLDGLLGPWIIENLSSLTGS